jgi:protein-L-isoaspartate O-methyltransferase
LISLPDIPTALSLPEARELARLAEGRRVVEAGALLGFSTVVLARAAASVVSVDRHEGYDAPTLGKFLRNLDRFGVQGRVEVRVGGIDLLSGSDAKPGRAVAICYLESTPDTPTGRLRSVNEC